jgi:L-asparaginase II
MRFARIRSGLAETSHDVACIALGADGAILFDSGPTDIPIFYRSAIKPFQALAAARTGLTLPVEHLALTCSSHGGYPVHLAIVDRILSDHGLDRGDLRCTPDRPSSRGADRIQLMAGRTGPEPRFHNCSGKHAGWLAACTVAGWDTAGYLDPTHPLQASVVGVVADVTGEDPRPTGIDGCGAPTLRGTITGLARGFLRLASDPELAPMADAMSRFGALIADNVRSDGRFALGWMGPSKGGAEGLFAAVAPGCAITTKSLDGDVDIAVAATLEVADRLGVLPRGTAAHLEDVRHPPQMGAGRPVGRLELVDV